MPGCGRGPTARSCVPFAASWSRACVPPCWGPAPVGRVRCPGASASPWGWLRLVPGLLLAPDADGLLGTTSLACIGLGALPPNRQVPPVSETPIGADLLESL